jgi:hypothetical protein
MATDRFRNVPTWYPTWGMQLAAQTEASATPLQDLAEMPRNLRLEGGVAGQVLPRNDVLDLYTATLFAGGAWTFPVGEDLPSPFVGTRLLGGGVWHSRGQGTLDGGAELRLGLEAGKFSAALGAGVTRHFHRLGLEMGLGL